MNAPVLVLFIWIGVGVRILGEVKSEHFANDTISLLQMEEKKKNRLKQSNTSSSCGEPVEAAGIIVESNIIWRTNLWVDADERVRLSVELLLQGDDNGLEVLHRLVLNVIGHLEVRTDALEAAKVQKPATLIKC